MKKIFLLVFFLLICTKCFADQACVKNLPFVGGVYNPEKGWHITWQKKGKTDKPLLFYYASFNYDHASGLNQNRISCFYENEKNDAEIEITTDEVNIAKPTGDDWKDLDKDSSLCFPGKVVNYADCRWG